MKAYSRLLTSLVAVAAVASACATTPYEGPQTDVDAALKKRISSVATVIAAGGASFPDAFYQAVNADYNAIAGAEVVTYAKSGSADGRTQLASGTLDLAGSDSLPSPSEQLPGDLLFFPTVAAPITISYNLPGIESLTLSAGTLAHVFQAQIDRWNDPRIVADNPGIELPDAPITVVHRSDGSGTTKNFTSYLVSAAGSVWRLGAGEEVAWPARTQGAEKNSGVAEVIRTTKGAVGYVDLGDAAKASLRIARVRNATGESVLPTAEATRAAVAGARPAADLTFDPLNSPAPGAYPITAPTWLLISASQTPDMAHAITTYLRYVLGPGLRRALALGYVPVADGLLERAREQIDRIHS